MSQGSRNDFYFRFDPTHTLNRVGILSHACIGSQPLAAGRRQSAL